MATATSQRHRPKADESPDAIRRALAGLDAERDAANQRVVAETERRTSLLLGGTPAEIRASEQAVRDAELDLERIAARSADLAPKLAAAIGREQIAEVETFRAAAETATEAFRTWWHEKYETLAREIAAGLELESNARVARATFHRVAAAAEGDPDVQAAGGVRETELPELPWAYIGQAAKSPRLLVCLPSVEPGQPAIAWPEGYGLGRAKVGAASAYG